MNVNSKKKKKKNDLNWGKNQKNNNNNYNNNDKLNHSQITFHSAPLTYILYRAPDQERFEDFPYFSKEVYVVTPH